MYLEHKFKKILRYFPNDFFLFCISQILFETQIAYTKWLKTFMNVYMIHTDPLILGFHCVICVYPKNLLLKFEKIMASTLYDLTNQLWKNDSFWKSWFLPLAKKKSFLCLFECGIRAKWSGTVGEWWLLYYSYILNEMTYKCLKIFNS